MHYCASFCPIVQNCAQLRWPTCKSTEVYLHFIVSGLPFVALPVFKKILFQTRHALSFGVVGRKPHPWDDTLTARYCKLQPPRLRAPPPQISSKKGVAKAQGPATLGRHIGFLMRFSTTLQIFRKELLHLFIHTRTKKYIKKKKFNKITKTKQ